MDSLAVEKRDMVATSEVHISVCEKVPEVYSEACTIQDQIQKQSVCGRWGFVNIESGEIKRFFCGSRRCHRKECAKIFHWRRVRLLDALVREHGLNYFFTLTLDPKLHEGECLWDCIPHVWSKFRKRIRRLEHNLKFVAVLEAHKNGRPHIHGFWNRFISWELVRDHWRDSGAGVGVFLDTVTTSGVADYVSKQLEVAKYVGKDQITGIPHSCKRALWRSKGLKAGFELTNEVKYAIIKEDVFNSEGEQIKRFFVEKKPCQT